jgi:inner membrane protein
MDSLTHIAIGACIGEAFAGKQLGRKAMFWGALAQSVPDLDFLASLWSSPAENLLAHRGFTHSVLFAVLITPLLALLAERWHRPHNIHTKRWMLFFGIQAFVHLFIDGMNVYGVGWFEPFSHHRVAFNWIFVADPFFSLWPGLAFLVLLMMKPRLPGRKWWVRFGLGMSAIYLLYCGVNKWKIDKDVRDLFARQQISYNGYFTTPTPLNNWLWYVVARTDSGFYTGYRSLFDRERTISFQYIPRNEGMLEKVSDHEDLQRLIRFSKGYYCVQEWQDTLVFNDIRFGQMIGWERPDARFVFHYYLRHPDDNALLVQRGRFAGWNKRSFLSLVKRIRGQ